MTKRRSAIIAFLLLAIMVTGIGFAALSDSLSITGTAALSVDNSRQEFEKDIYFTKALGDPTRVSAAVNSGDNDLVEIEVLANTLKAVGDEVVVTCTIKSDSDLTVNIEDLTISNDNEEYFTVSAEFAGGTTQITPNGTKDVVVTIRMIKTPVADQNLNFSVTFNAKTA